MNADITTELNYLWKVNMVGSPYMNPDADLITDSPSGEPLTFTILTNDREIKPQWEEGKLSL
jgi:hypothetical protein